MHRIILLLLLTIAAQAVDTKPSGGGSGGTTVITSSVTASANDAFYPRGPGVYQSVASDAANLQGILNTHKAVALAPGVIYTGAVTLTTGMRLYGLGNTVGALTVAAGSSNVLIRAISSSGLTFAAGAAITACSLEHIVGAPISETGAIISGCFFNDINQCPIAFDNSSTGRVSDCRFYRFSCGGAIVISMKGNATTPNFGNTWVHTNPLTVDSTGPNIYADNYSDLTFIGVDVERYVGGSNGDCFQLSTGAGMTRIVGVNGGPQSGVFVDTQSSGFYGADWTPAPPINVQWASNAGNSFMATEAGMVNDSDLSTGKTRFMAMNSGGTTVTVGGVSTPTLSGAQSAALAALAYPARGGVTWGSPTFTSAPPPHVPNDAATLAAAVDSSAYIQSLLNASTAATGPAMLGPGVWYVNATLSFASGQGLVGAGKDRTYIVAMNPAIPVATFATDNFTWRYIADLTLEGGTAGLQTTISTYVADTCVVNVCFRDSVTAGVWLNAIGDIDNCTWSNCDYVNCGAGVKLNIIDINQFIDKNFWCHCRFLGCGSGVSMISSRASNMVGFANCLFSDNVTNAVTMNACTVPLFVGCSFTNNGGNPTVASTASISGVCVGCTWTANAAGTSMVDNFSLFDCTFQRGTSGSAVMLGTGTGARVISNCTSVDMPAGTGTLTNAVILNTKWAAGDVTPPAGIYAYSIGSVQTVAVAGTPTPVPQLLRNSTAWSSSLENGQAPDGEPPAVAALAYAQPSTGGVGVGSQTLSGSLLVPIAAKPLNQVTLGAVNYFSNPTGLSDGQLVSIAATQDATGSRTATWAPIYCFAGGTAPTLTTTAGATDIFNFRYQASTGNLINVGSTLNAKSSATAGVLDGVTASALTAYSLRLLYRNYAGPLVRLQRASDSAQADFYPPATADGNGNKFITLAGATTAPGGTGTTLASWSAATSAVILTWYDQTGHGNHATQTTAANCLQLTSAGALNTFGANAAGISTGTTTAYSMPDNSIPDHSGGNNFAVDAVVNPTPNGSNQNYNIAFGHAGAGNYSLQGFCYVPLTGGNAQIINDWQGPGVLTATLTGTFTGPLIMGWDYDGTTQSIWRNGTSVASQTPSQIGGVAPLVTCVFLTSINGKFAYVGGIAECIFFGLNKHLNTADRQTLTRSQGTAWTITVP